MVIIIQIGTWGLMGGKPAVCVINKNSEGRAVSPTTTLIHGEGV